VDKRRSILMTDPQFAFLEAEGERLGMSVADLIRRIIHQFQQATTAGPA
jgi:hypothetical protein